ncbi:MAG: bifunctional 3-(3-hydroxy-phenyl)propionate/3-hydroxycinnamic acid hydroxylase [Pseudomonadota bacterium]
MLHTDVLIVGLGPIGAILAGLLVRLGLTVKVVERDLDVYKQPRAIVLDDEVVRQLNLLGVADEVLAHSKPAKGYEFLNSNREVLTRRPPFLGKTPTGYHPANLFHQPSMERAVRAMLAKEPAIDIELGIEFLALEQDVDGVNAIFRGPDGLRELKAKTLIGCDGGRSLVRRIMDIQMEDLNFDEPWVVVDVKVLTDDTGLSENGVQLCDPSRPTTCVPSGPGRHRWEFMLKPGETNADVTNPDSLRRWISAWTDPDKIELERSAVYRFHGLVAKHWRRGRAMIIGDAAHQMPPFMGQGLCAGARDACNLAWKLNSVLRGEAPWEFLDTVQEERIPHVKEVTKGAIAMGKTVCVTDPEEAARRDAQMMEDHRSGKGFAFPGVPTICAGVMDDEAAGTVAPEPFCGSDTDPQRIDDVVGYVPLLILKDAADVADAHVAALRKTSPDLAIAALSGEANGVHPLLDNDGFMAAAMGGKQAALIKPDRIIFGTDDLPAIAEAWHRYLSGEMLGHRAERRAA